MDNELNYCRPKSNWAKKLYINDAISHLSKEETEALKNAMKDEAILKHENLLDIISIIAATDANKRNFVIRVLTQTNISKRCDILDILTFVSNIELEEQEEVLHLICLFSKTENNLIDMVKKVRNLSPENISILINEFSLRVDELAMENERQEYNQRIKKLNESGRNHKRI